MGYNVQLSGLIGAMIIVAWSEIILLKTLQIGISFSPDAARVRELGPTTNWASTRTTLKDDFRRWSSLLTGAWRRKMDVVVVR